MPDPKGLDGPMTDEEIEEVEKRAEAATAGPWHYFPCGDKQNDCVLGVAYVEGVGTPPPGRVDDDDGMNPIVDEIADRMNDANYADFAFMAHARTDIPRLIATIRDLKNQLKWDDGYSKIVADALGKPMTEGFSAKAIAEAIQERDKRIAELEGKSS